ncbi:hypothetical protein J6590_057887 [Homalodisca vitripennis]|nr:hypothetical protein J6590_057887 [Homalodisca vitripennis]
MASIPLAVALQLSTKTSKSLTKSNNSALTEDTQHRLSPKKQKISKNGVYKRQEQKAKRLRGLEYCTVKGKLVNSRPLKQARCSGRAKHKCLNNVPEEQREKIYNDFHNCLPYRNNGSFLSNMSLCDQLQGKLQKQWNHTDLSPRNTHFSTKNGTFEVCREFFLDTLNISESLIRGAREKVNSSGVLLLDLRGKKDPPNKCKKFIAHEEQKHDADYDDSLYIEHCKRKEAARKIIDKDKEDAKEQQNVLQSNGPSSCSQHTKGSQWTILLHGWCQVIRTARTKPKPFEVTPLCHDDFIDFSVGQDKIVVVDPENNKNHLPFKKAIWFQYRKTEPDELFVKTDYAENAPFLERSIVCAGEVCTERVVTSAVCGQSDARPGDKTRTGAVTMVCKKLLIRQTGFSGDFFTSGPELQNVSEKTGRGRIPLCQRDHRIYRAKFSVADLDLGAVILDILYGHPFQHMVTRGRNVHDYNTRGRDAFRSAQHRLQA